MSLRNLEAKQESQENIFEATTPGGPGKSMSWPGRRLGGLHPHGRLVSKQAIASTTTYVREPVIAGRDAAAQPGPENGHEHCCLSQPHALDPWS